MARLCFAVCVGSLLGAGLAVPAAPSEQAEAALLEQDSECAAGEQGGCGVSMFQIRGAHVSQEQDQPEVDADAEVEAGKQSREFAQPQQQATEAAHEAAHSNQSFRAPVLTELQGVSAGNSTVGSRCCTYPFACNSCAVDYHVCKNTWMCSACDCNCCNPNEPRSVVYMLNPLLECDTSRSCSFHQSITRGASSSQTDVTANLKASGYASESIDKQGFEAEASLKYHRASQESFSTYSQKIDIDCLPTESCYVYQVVIRVNMDRGYVEFRGSLVHSLEPLHYR